jgi:hypothetical protein
MTLTERHLAAKATARSATSLGTNLAAVLALCSMNGATVQDRAVDIRFPDALPRTTGVVEVASDVDSLLAQEIFSFVHWLVTSQVALDHVSKAALYEDRWDHYL